MRTASDEFDELATLLEIEERMERHRGCSRHHRREVEAGRRGLFARSPAQRR